MTYILGIGLLALQVALAVHVVRTGRPIFWIFIILLFPFVGSLAYIFAVLIPEWERNRTIQNAVERLIVNLKRLLSGETSTLL